MVDVAVIDYGMGNLHSASKALEFVAPGKKIVVTSDRDEILAAERVMFPGVGAIRDCMAEIRRLELDTLLPELIKTRPVLAICVGMQALMDSSEENQGVDCIGVLPGKVRFFGDNLVDAKGEKLKVPHMGWNQVKQVQDHPIWHGIEQDSRFYFVHSYYVEAENSQQIIGSTEYNSTFTSVLADKNLVACQFHPEKSQHAGLALLKNFVNWDGSC
ncbi:MAG: imidazole glycerol phosphate synthase subunit HisH [Pseudomonadales bacterium]|nr:imidazole glycerol phosphate synthase subunit HisH [Pseudomonadales bacterium]